MTKGAKYAVGVGLVLSIGLLYLAAREDAPGVNRYEAEAEERRRYYARRAHERLARGQRKAETRYARRMAVEDVRT